MHSLLSPALLGMLKIHLSVCWHLLLGLLQWLVPRQWQAKRVDRDTVLVTGAGSGLGRELALEFARLGSSLVLWDIDEVGVAETGRQVRQEQVAWAEARQVEAGACLSERVDVGDRQVVYEAARRLQAALRSAGKNNTCARTAPYVSVLVNNAGIYHGLLFTDLTDQQVERVVKVNLMAHFWTVRAFLPDMIQHKRGHLLEIASMAGLGGLFKQVDYCATKYATVGFEEALSFELDHLGLGEQVRTTVVCPFFFGSNLFTGFRGARNLMRADWVAQEAVWAVRCNHERVLLPKLKSYLFAATRNLMTRRALIQFTKLFDLATALENIKGKAALDVLQTRT